MRKNNFIISVFLVFFLCEGYAFANEISAKKLKVSTKHPMTVMSDDPSVKKIEAWKKLLKNKKIRSNKYKSSVADAKKDVKTIVKLEVSNVQGKLVNKSKSFVFKDKTQRGMTMSSLVNNQKRHSQIEKLRHLYAK